MEVIPDYHTRFSKDLHFIEINGITQGEESDQEVTISVYTGDVDLIETLGADLVGNGKAFINYRLKDGATGTAKVKVTVTDNGATPETITRTFHIITESLHRDLPTKSILQKSSNYHLKVYPNPAFRSTHVYFSTPHDEQQVAVNIYTLTGVKVQQLFTGKTVAGQPYHVDVNSGNLASGVYIVRLTAPSHTSNLNLVVAR